MLGGIFPSDVAGDKKAASLLDKLLVSQGASLSNLVSKTRAYTFIGVELDKSVGDCPPCTAYHKKMNEKFKAGSALDAEFVSILLMAPK